MNVQIHKTVGERVLVVFLWAGPWSRDGKIAAACGRCHWVSARGGTQHSPFQSVPDL